MSASVPFAKRDTYFTPKYSAIAASSSWWYFPLLVSHLVSPDVFKIFYKLIERRHRWLCNIDCFFDLCFHGLSLVAV